MGKQQAVWNDCIAGNNVIISVSKPVLGKDVSH
jgi:hypothetical protein